jgi:2'-5' RNA ligase
MRLFTAIDIPEEVREHLERVITHLRPSAHVKWSTVYNLHITLKFIGEWAAPGLEKLEAALASVAPRLAVPVDVRGVGWFPNQHHPRVFWAGILSGPELETLARDIETSLEPLGIAKEDRDFSPHLTLARIKQPTPLHTLRQAVTDLGAVEFGAFRSDRFGLYRSQPGAAGSIYTKLSEYPFATPA